MKRKKQRKNEDRLRPFTDYSKPAGRPHFMKSQSWEGGVILESEDIPQIRHGIKAAVKADRVRAVTFVDTPQKDKKGPKDPLCSSIDFPCYEKPKFSFTAGNNGAFKKENEVRETIKCQKLLTDDIASNEPHKNKCSMLNTHLQSSTENLMESFDTKPSSTNPRQNLSVQYSVPASSSIITTTRSEYTSITDDIDTTCLKYPSPGGSPVTPHKSFMDFYVPNEDKSDLLGKRKNLQLSEAEQLKNAEESEHAQMETMIRKRMRHISLTETDSLGDIAKHVVNELTTSSESSDSSTSSQQSVYSENDGRESPEPIVKKGLKHVKSEPAFHLQQVKATDHKMFDRSQSVQTNGPSEAESEAFPKDQEVLVKKKRVSYLDDIVESAA